MTMTTTLTLHCDRCSHYWPGGTGMKARAVRAAAKEGGWKLGKSKDFCKTCTAEISAAIKLAQAGEIK